MQLSFGSLLLVVAAVAAESAAANAACGVTAVLSPAQAAAELEIARTRIGSAELVRERTRVTTSYAETALAALEDAATRGAVSDQTLAVARQAVERGRLRQRLEAFLIEQARAERDAAAARADAAAGPSRAAAVAEAKALVAAAAAGVSAFRVALSVQELQLRYAADYLARIEELYRSGAAPWATRHSALEARDLELVDVQIAQNAIAQAEARRKAAEARLADVRAVCGA